MKVVAIDTNVLLDFRLKRKVGFKTAQQLITDRLGKQTTADIYSNPSYS